MERHHETQLYTALDHLYVEGVVTIRWDHLYLWFNTDRLNKNAYREIIRRWEELCTVIYEHKSAPELSVVSHREDKSTLTLLREPFDGEQRVSPLSGWT